MMSFADYAQLFKTLCLAGDYNRQSRLSQKTGTGLKKGQTCLEKVKAEPACPRIHSPHLHLLRRRYNLQRVLQIGDQIVRILNAYGEADHLLGHAHLGAV